MSRLPSDAPPEFDPHLPRERLTPASGADLRMGTALARQPHSRAPDACRAGAAAGGSETAMMNPECESPGVPSRANPLKRLYNWVLSWADTPYGTPALFFLSLAESSVFPIPPDVLQIALSVARPKRSLFYAAVSTAGSVVGGAIGWWLGFALWAAVGDFFFSYVPGFTQQNFDHVAHSYQNNAFLAIFAAAFTPIPYKIFTIAAGVCQVSLATLLIASVLGRGGRFFLVGGCIYLFGPRVKAWLDRYLEITTVALVVLGVLGFAAVKYLF